MKIYKNGLECGSSSSLNRIVYRDRKAIPGPMGDDLLARRSPKAPSMYSCTLKPRGWFLVSGILSRWFRAFLVIAIYFCHTLTRRKCTYT